MKLLSTVFALAALFLVSVAEAAIVYVNTSPPTYYGLSSDTKPLNNPAGSYFYETNTSRMYVWSVDKAGSASDWKEFYIPMYLASRNAGDRSITSTTGTDYMAAQSECASSGEIDLASGDQIIYAGPALLCGYLITVTPGTAASSIDNNTTVKIPLPVSFPVKDYNAFGAIFTNSLRVKRGASATGKLVLYYKPLDPRVTWAP